MMSQGGVTVLQTNTRRDTGKKAQFGNIMAAKVRGSGDACDQGAATPLGERWFTDGTVLRWP